MPEVRAILLCLHCIKLCWWALGKRSSFLWQLSRDENSRAVERRRGFFNLCFKFRAHKLWVYTKWISWCNTGFDPTNCCSERRIQKDGIFLWCDAPGLGMYCSSVPSINALKKRGYRGKILFCNIQKNWWNCVTSTELIPGKQFCSHLGTTAIVKMITICWASHLNW